MAFPEGPRVRSGPAGVGIVIEQEGIEEKKRGTRSAIRLDYAQ